MGYYTSFSLNIWDKDGQWIDEGNPIFDKIAERFETITSYNKDDFEEMVHYAIELKWYEWKEDMKKIVADFPDVKFEIDGRGEQNDDWWVAQWYNGDYAVEYVVPPEGKLF